MEESGYGDEYFCLCDYPRDVLRAYHRLLGLCHGFPPGLVVHGVSSLLRDRRVAFGYGGGRDRAVPVTLHDEALQVFHPGGTIQYHWYTDAAGLDGMGVFLLQRLSGSVVWRGCLGQAGSGVYREGSPG